jgi:hypothetical protein
VALCKTAKDKSH